MGMMGIKCQINDIALIESCDDKKVDSYCYFENQKIKWIDYVKKQMPEWYIDFDMTSSEKQILVQKWKKIWIKIG